MDADGNGTRSDTDERGIIYFYPCKSVLVRVLIIGRGVTRMDADGDGTWSDADGRGGDGTRSDTDKRGIVYFYPCKSMLVYVLIIGRGVTQMNAE